MRKKPYPKNIRPPGLLPLPPPPPVVVVDALFAVLEGPEVFNDQTVYSCVMLPADQALTGVSHSGGGGGGGDPPPSFLVRRRGLFLELS